jgi:hypothetical protein
MATLSFSFDTGSVTVARIVDAMAITYGYQATIPDPQNAGQSIANPETKAQFAKAQIKRIITEAVKNAEMHEARKAAEATVTDITLT